MHRPNGLRPTAFNQAADAEALALLGKDAAELSASAVGRLKDGWFDEHAAWQKRDLSAKRSCSSCSASRISGYKAQRSADNIAISSTRTHVVSPAQSKMFTCAA